MVGCAACGQIQNTESKEKQISFHRFPKNKERRQEWRKFVNRIHWVPTNNSFICSPHFTEECFDRSSALTVRLNENAIPTIIIDRTKNTRADKCRKRRAEEIISKQKAVCSTNADTNLTSHSTPVKDITSCSIIENVLSPSQYSSRSTTPLNVASNYINDDTTPASHSTQIEDVVPGSTIIKNVLSQSQNSSRSITPSNASSIIYYINEDTTPSSHRIETEDVAPCSSIIENDLSPSQNSSRSTTPSNASSIIYYINEDTTPSSHSTETEDVAPCSTVIEDVLSASQNSSRSTKPSNAFSIIKTLPSTPQYTQQTNLLQKQADDTPSEIYLKTKLHEISVSNRVKSNKIRILQKMNWEQEKRINTLRYILSKLEKMSKDDYIDT